MPRSVRRACLRSFEWIASGVVWRSWWTPARTGGPAIAPGRVAQALLAVFANAKPAAVVARRRQHESRGGPHAETTELCLHSRRRSRLRGPRVFGGRLQCSPSLDRMAADGVLYTNAYASSSVCSPSRIAIATGRYQHRVLAGFDEPIAGPGRPKGLPPEVPTMASMLRDAGYATALVGKWHMGRPPEFGPLRSGYQEFFGPLGGAVDYFRHSAVGRHDLWDGEQGNAREGLSDRPAHRARGRVHPPAVGTDALPALAALQRAALAWETREDEAEANRIEDIAHLDGGSVRTYARMIHHMDEGIGKVLAALDAIGARENTVVVFTSDNGGERFSDTYPLLGKKMDLLEGGIRVPCIVRWPERVPVGERVGRLAVGMDWTPTFLAAAGVTPDPKYPLDGIDLFGPDGERTVFWRMLYRTRRPCGRAVEVSLRRRERVSLRPVARRARAGQSALPRARAVPTAARRVLRLGRVHAVVPRGREVSPGLLGPDHGSLGGIARRGAT